ncbi:MAG: hypothetical protein U1D69_09925, partial [Polynucleobacter sp.]|nr:hypothetical protein [Polynucleobacter sp.]
YEWVKRTTVGMSVIGAMIVSAIALPLYLASDWLLIQWMGRSFPGQSQIIAWLCGVSVLMAIVSPFNMVLNSVGGLRIQLFAWVALLGLALPLKYLLLEPSSLHLLALVTFFTYGATVGVAVIFAVWRSGFGRYREGLL